MYAVEITNVHGTMVWRGVRLIMLIHVQSKKYYINAIQVLKDDNALASILELRGVILEGIPLLHSRPDF
jgi:hypothetical protein